MATILTKTMSKFPTIPTATNAQRISDSGAGPVNDSLRILLEDACSIADENTVHGIIMHMSLAGAQSS